MILFTQIIIWIVAIAYAVYLAIERFYFPTIGGKTLAAPALRRRIADPLMLLAAVIYGIYMAATQVYYLPLLLPLSVLAVVLCLFMLRRPRWLLKEQGFLMLGKVIPYQQISNTQLYQNGILQITLNNGGKIPIAFANLQAVEEAAAFFANEGHVAAMLREEEKTL